MTVADRAAEVIHDWSVRHAIPPAAGVRPTDTLVAAALVAAGLLLTDADRAVLDAVTDLVDQGPPYSLARLIAAERARRETHA